VPRERPITAEDEAIAWGARRKECRFTSIIGQEDVITAVSGLCRPLPAEIRGRTGARSGKRRKSLQKINPKSFSPAVR